MIRRPVDAWLADIVIWGGRLERHLAGVDWARFAQDELLQDAVSKCAEVVGEAAGKIDDLAPDLNQAVPGLELKLARRSRDRLVHGYHAINIAILWTTVTESIPRTVAAARRLIETDDDRASSPRDS